MGKSGLSKGLESIFGDNLSDIIEDIQHNESNQTNEIDVDEIRPNPYQPRRKFDEEKLKELSNSIKTHGVFQPILVRQAISGYELVAGERRLRASKMAGLTTIPAIVIEFNDDQMMEVSLLENIQREDLSAIEEASAYEKLIQNLNYTQEELAKRIGKSRTHITNTLRLLKLPVKVQQMVQDNKLQMGHVRPLLALDDENQICEIADMIEEKGLSVREVEKLVKDITNPEPVKPKEKKEKSKDLVYVENLLENKLKTKVSVNKSNLVIKYNGVDDLNRILEILDCFEDSMN